MSKRSDTVLNLSYASWSQQSTDKKSRPPSKLQILPISEVHSLGPQIIDVEQFEHIMASVHSVYL